MNCRAGASPAETNRQPERLPYNVRKTYARAGVDVDVSNQPTLGRADFNRGGLIEPYRLGRVSDDFVEARIIAQLIPNRIQL